MDGPATFDPKKFKRNLRRQKQWLESLREKKGEKREETPSEETDEKVEGSK